jgi:hypothetical protein
MFLSRSLSAQTGPVLSVHIRGRVRGREREGWRGKERERAAKTGPVVFCALGCRATKPWRPAFVAVSLSLCLSLCLSLSLKLSYTFGIVYRLRLSSFSLSLSLSSLFFSLFVFFPLSPSFSPSLSVPHERGLLCGRCYLLGKCVDIRGHVTRTNVRRLGPHIFHPKTQKSTHVQLPPHVCD